MAYQLSEQGAQFALAAHHPEMLEAVASACQERGGQAIAVPTDLTDETQCQQLIERTVAEYGRIDTLLNNAGLGYPKPFADLPDLHTLRLEIDLNYMGTAYCTHFDSIFVYHCQGLF